ncbi:MAG: hypothetical protein JXK05_00340 [Campylobacterales bacterium]|nr:hypothetical protein [Campylobacterales bacterium]
MSLNKKLFLLLFVLIVAVLVGFILRFEGEVRRQSINDVGDRLSVALHAQLEREKEDALRIALVLSHNPLIVQALRKEEEDWDYAILDEAMEGLNKHTATLVRAQIITPEYAVFARSWDNAYAGMPLEDSRSDLDYFKTKKIPRVSIEVGRRLGIKATVPLFDGRQLAGFVEVLQFFDATTAFFREFGVDLYVLLDDAYYNTAVLMQNNMTIGSYIVANRGHNAAHLKTLERVDMKRLRQNRALRLENTVCFFEPMHNAEGKLLGAYVMVMDQEQMELLRAVNENLSIFINFSRRDLYDIVKKEALEEQIYRSRYDKALLYLKDTVPEEDKELFIQEAREMLESYSKEELIALILKHKNAKKIEGEIR